MRSWKVALGVSTIFLLSAVAGLAPSLGEPEPAAEHVHIDDFAFVPDDLIIRPGETVDWHNHDTAAHTATADNGDWDTGSITNGETGSRTFADSGTWSYHCAFHPDMEADLVVNLLPLVAIDTPQDGSDVEGIVTIEGTATDVDGTVEEVEVRIDGGDWQTATGTTSWSYDWDTTQEPNGANLVEARSYDGIEHSELEAITLIVDNPTFVDLEITPEDVEAGTGLFETQIEVTVHNQGNIEVPPFTITLEYEHNGEDHLIDEVTVEGLAGFSSHTVTASWDTLGKIGDFDVTATADPGGETGDVDPTNNQATAPVSILVGGVEGIDLFDL